MMRWRTLFSLVLWFSTTALLIKILGYLLPWWFVARAPGSMIDRFYIGIIFGLDCAAGVAKRNCSEYSIGHAPTETNNIVESASMLVIQIAMSCNIGLLFISAMIIIGSAVTRMYNLGLAVLTCVLMSLSCVAYLLTLGFFIYLHINEVKERSAVYEYTGENFPWSILIVSVGAIFLFAALTLLIAALCRWRDDDDVSIISYDERKIVEYPETRYVYDNPKQYSVVERPMVHAPSSRSYVYTTEAPTKYQQITYPSSETMYRPYVSSRRY